MTWFTAPPWGETAQVRVQHVLTDGTERFVHDGLCVPGDPGLHHMLPAAVYDEATSEIVVFFVDEMPREPLPSLYALRAQRVGAIGVLLWGADGRLLTDWRETQLIYTRAVRSGDHFVAMWDELGDVAFSATLLAAALDGDGHFAWPRKVTPLAAILNGEQKLHPHMVAAPDGGLLVAWSESRVDWGDIMAQRVNPEGTLGLPWSWADFTGDGAVDYADYELFLRAFGGTLDAGHYDAEADYDADGLISLVDYQRWLAAYRLHVGNPAARPPTPPTRAMSPNVRPNRMETARPASGGPAPTPAGSVSRPQR